MATSVFESLTTELALLNSNTTKIASKFMAIASDDLLTEILLRLPNAQAAIQSSTVCKRWCSLINNPHFRKCFVEYHSHENHSDFSLLFKWSYKPEVPYFILPSEELWGCETEPYDLSFIPDSADCEIKATCGDLFLVGRAGEEYRAILEYYICNSLTKHWFALPVIPQILDFESFSIEGSYGHALVCDPDSKETYKVLVICMSCFLQVEFSFHTAAFDTDAKEWTFARFPVPHEEAPYRWAYYPIALEIVLTSEGVVYWLDGLRELRGVAAFDPFRSRFRLLCLPNGQFSGISPDGSMDKVRIGVVRGRLRLSRMIKINNRSFGLRIWELDGNGDSWNLLHDVAVEIRAKQLLAFVLAFDPSNGSVVFLVRDGAIFRYDIDRDAYERVCVFPFPCCDGSVFPFPCCDGSVDRMKEKVANYLRVLTAVRPPWPTPIPPLHHH